MRVLFTICGRAGSKGIKNKNLKKMKGIPLVYYTLAAIELYCTNHPEVLAEVALNTDSDKLSAQVKKQNRIRNIRILPRKSELAGDRTAKVDVIRDCYLRCCGSSGDKEEKDYDAVVDLDLTSPIRRAEDIENAIDTLLSNPDTELVYSVVEGRRSPYFNMVEEQEGYYRKVCASNYTARQQAPRVYELNASIYAYRPAFLKEKIEQTILEHRGTVTIMPDYLVLDIDSEEDFERMSYLITYFVERDEGLRRVIELAGEYIN